MRRFWEKTIWKRMCSMGFIDCASNASIWRGYEYYETKQVKSWTQVDKTKYEGFVKGSSSPEYSVKIDALHPRKGACNCPYADGKRIVCKHQIALYFTVFPDEAERFMQEVEEYEREEEQREQELYEDIVNYVNSLSVEQLRLELIQALMEKEDDDFYW